jgi:CDP-glucose 4,6-dehydratase
VAVLRLANVYGGGDFNMSRIVPDTISSLVKGRPPVIRSDGSPERDYIYAEDAAAGYLTVADSLESEDNYGRAWNLGAGARVSVLEMVNGLIAAAGSDLEPDIQGEGVPPGEIDRQQLDSTAIREELGWEPLWDLEKGLAATYDWYRENLG